MSETKIKHSPNLNITIYLRGYFSQYQNYMINVGGVGIYIGNLLHYEKITLKYDVPFSGSLWIRIKSTNSINYVI